MRNTPRLCEMQLANEPLERPGVTPSLNAQAPAPAAQRRAVRPDRTMSHVELATFDNGTGEGIVSFEPSRTSGPEYDADHSRWYHHLLVAGQRVFEYGCPCGTCGIVFRKVGTSAHRVSDSEAFRLLGHLDFVPSNEILRRLARVLQPGFYHPAIVEGTVRLIEPGGPADYFASDVVRLCGLEPPDYEQASGPRTPYYRLGSDSGLERTGRTTGPHNALVAAVIMPLHDPSRLSRERVNYWLRQSDAGTPLTAFAVAVIDNQQPAMSPADPSYPYEEHFLFTNCLLYGHHRVQAAAESGRAVRILSLLARESSLVERVEDISAVLRGYHRRAEP